ncbi:MAG: P-type conjugative transfer protein TrbJ [Rhizobiaceae bacterium]
MKLDLTWLKHTASVAALSLGLMLGSPPHEAVAKIVFDPWNYRQNILTAVRTLTEINQQIDQLRNEAQMLLKMDLDLTKLTETVSPDLMRTLGEIKTLMDEAEGIAMKVRETDQAMRELFPKGFEAAISGDEITRNVKARWQETLAAYRRSANLQARVSESVETDGDLLATLLDRSRAAVGNLQATQAGNELSGLSIKQSLQLQQLLAAHYRAETLERSRRMASEEEARVRFKSFLGSSGGAYSPGG